VIKFKLNSNIKDRFEKYLSSDLFHDQAVQTKSNYWNYHSKQIKYFIKNNHICLGGDSGFYMPDKKYSISSLWKAIKLQLKRVINYKNSYYLPYKKVFDKVMNDSKVVGFQQVHLDKEKIIAKKVSDCKKIFPLKNHTINFHIIKTYYWFNILSSYLDLSDTKFVAEIGAGNGNFISLLKYHSKTKCIVNIDLPETLVHCIAYLAYVFPNSKILFPNEIDKKINKEILANYDFVFITPSQIQLLDDNIIDLFINTGSFCEMNNSQIGEYFKLVQRCGKNDSFFFNVNRVEKIPHAGKKNNDFKNIKPIRFFEYPFFRNNEVLIFEICKFFRLLIKDPVYVRLERIKK